MTKNLLGHESVYSSPGQADSFETSSLQGAGNFYSMTFHLLISVTPRDKFNPSAKSAGRKPPWPPWLHTPPAHARLASVSRQDPPTPRLPIRPSARALLRPHSLGYVAPEHISKGSRRDPMSFCHCCFLTYSHPKLCTCPFPLHPRRAVF